MAAATGARAEEPWQESWQEAAQKPGRWAAPFGGTFNANITVASDYSYAGISNSALGPALQLGLDYRTPNLIERFPFWLYLSGWGSNTTQPAGQGVEIDVTAGMKALLLDRRLKLDLGYVRVNYPGFPGALGYDYGDISINVDYDLGWATASGRLRFSPNSFGNSGWAWNKRGMFRAPLPFLQFDERFSFTGYASLGNLWVDNYVAYGIPSNDYWYWQVGLVTSAFGLDLTLAYTGTNISAEGCGHTNDCASRVFVSLTKVF
ncbi:MAG: hypothetical protein JSR90_14815 [Proteobacteria bacterium]|nr:hypothetical protein [Pseudomonadota bacterium]